MVTVSVGVLGEVVLVVSLSRVELGSGCDLSLNGGALVVGEGAAGNAVLRGAEGRGSKRWAKGC